MDITHEDFCGCELTAEQCQDKRQAEAAKSLAVVDPALIG